MTPSALSFENCSPKSRYRGNPRRLFEAVQVTMTGIRKASKSRMEYRKTTQASCISAESCDEEDNLSKRQCSSTSSPTSCNPNISSKCIGDSHIEASDEDADNYSSCPEDMKRTENGGVQRFGGLFKDGFSIKVESGETAFGNDYCLSDRNSARNFYIIKSDGRPAEMFRTDLFDKLRKGIDDSLDSDDEDVPGTGLIRMTDRWRAEWSNGTQVPMGTNLSNGPGVRKAVVSRNASCNASIQHQRHQLMKKFFSKPYESSVVSPLRLYECTALDKQWLKLLNEHRLCNAKPPLSMEMFLEIMNDFEIECYKNIHQKLLEPLHSPSSRLNEEDDEAACDICRICECEPEDEMVFCDGCNLCVHMSCYGLQQLPPGEWLCMKCRLCFGRNPPCTLCPTIGGALKRIDMSGQWAHVVCALWIHECRFGDFEKREPITCINQIKEERWVAKCAICDTRQGACIKCSVSSCKIWFHATCALRSGLEMRIEQDLNDDKVNMVSLCPRHRTARPYDNDESKSETDQISSDEEADGLHSIGMLRKLEQTCYLYVSYEETAARLKQDPLLVADVFEFWKRKRLQLNNGRPLIDNLQDEIKIGDPDVLQLNLPDCDTSSVAPSSPLTKRPRGRPRKYPVQSMESPQSAVVNESYNGNMEDMDVVYSRLLHSLKEGRKLLDLVVQRCQAERAFTLTHLRVMMKILDYVTAPVPLSHRRLSFFSEVLEEFCPKIRSDGAEGKAEVICAPDDSETVRGSLYSKTNSSVQFCKSTSTSTSPVFRPSLRSMKNCKNQEEKHERLSVPRRCYRSHLNCLPTRKRNVKQRYSVLRQMEEQGNIRRRSLRSWNNKSSGGSGNTTLERTTRTTHRNHSLSMESIRSPVCTAGMRFNTPRCSEPSVDGIPVDEDKRSIEGLVNGTGAPSSKQSSISHNSERNRVRLRSESLAISEKLGSPLHKRWESMAETSNAEMRLLRSQNKKSLNKDSSQCLKEFAIRGDDEANEIRILRSRSSLPPMFKRDCVLDRSRIKSKSVVVARIHAKRRSDHRYGFLRPRARCIH